MASAPGAGKAEVVLLGRVDEVRARETLVDVEARQVHEVVVVPEGLAVLGLARADVLDVGEVVRPRLVRRDERREAEVPGVGRPPIVDGGLMAAVQVRCELDRRAVRLALADEAVMERDLRGAPGLGEDRRAGAVAVVGPDARERAGREDPGLGDAGVDRVQVRRGRPDRHRGGRERQREHERRRGRTGAVAHGGTDPLEREEQPDAARDARLDDTATREPQVRVAGGRVGMSRRRGAPIAQPDHRGGDDDPGRQRHDGVARDVECERRLRGALVRGEQQRVGRAADGEDVAGDGR